MLSKISHCFLECVSWRSNQTVWLTAYFASKRQTSISIPRWTYQADIYYDKCQNKWKILYRRWRSNSKRECRDLSMWRFSLSKLWLLFDESAIKQRNYSAESLQGNLFELKAWRGPNSGTCLFSMFQLRQLDWVHKGACHFAIRQKMCEIQWRSYGKQPDSWVSDNEAVFHLIDPSHLNLEYL